MQFHHTLLSLHRSMTEQMRKCKSNVRFMNCFMESFLFPHACVRRVFIEEEYAPHPPELVQEPFRLSRRFQSYAAPVTNQVSSEHQVDIKDLLEEKFITVQILRKQLPVKFRAVLLQRNF